MCPSIMSIMDGWRVAAVVSPEALAALERVQDRQAVRTLAEVFAEIRACGGDDGYELETAERRDRPGWPVDEP